MMPQPMPQGQPMPGPQPSAQQDQFSGLQNLTREELVELDSLITPRLATLLVKAFPWAQQALAPLLANDMEEQGEQMPALEQQGASPGGPIPRPTSPLGRIGE